MHVFGRMRTTEKEQQYILDFAIRARKNSKARS